LRAVGTGNSFMHRTDAYVRSDIEFKLPDALEPMKYGDCFKADLRGNIVSAELIGDLTPCDDDLPTPPA
jgi:hypothetical protein